MNKKENSKNLVKKMLLSISIMSFFVSAGIENVNAMNENIFEAIKKGRSDNKSRRNAALLSAPSAPMATTLAAKQDNSGYRLAVPDSPTLDQKTNNSLIINSLNEESEKIYVLGCCVLTSDIEDFLINIGFDEAFVFASSNNKKKRIIELVSSIPNIQNSKFIARSLIRAACNESCDNLDNAYIALQKQRYENKNEKLDYCTFCKILDYVCGVKRLGIACDVDSLLEKYKNGFFGPCEIVGPFDEYDNE